MEEHISRENNRIRAHSLENIMLQSIASVHKQKGYIYLYICSSLDFRVESLSITPPARTLPDAG